MEKQIASIYFEKVKAERPLYAGYFEIPAVPKSGTPSIKRIPDHIQLSQEPSPDGKSKVTKRDLVTGEEISADILREWTENMADATPQCHPGIWIVRDTISIVNDDGTLPRDAMGKPLTRPATREERESMWNEDFANAKACDANWAEMLINRGDVLSQDVKQWRMISPTMKKAAKHYGRDRTWLQELKDSDVKACPFCAAMIPVNAVKCKCGEVVDVRKYAELIAKRDQAVEAAKRGALNPPVQNQPTAA